MKEPSTQPNDYHQEFPLDPDLVYLNHAAVAPWPQCARDAVVRFANENTHRGAADYPKWLALEQSLRENLARLINAPSPLDVALCKNTSEALSFVAQGLNWSPGDEIIITDQEFPSNRIVWEVLANQGVKLRVANISRQDIPPEAAIEAEMTPRTRLVSISSVQYGTGLRLDVARIGALCRAKDILFCLDAIQSIGAEPLDVQAANVDFTMADGHKWMLGPEGLALFYVRPEVREQLQLQEFGWHMVADRGNYDRKDWEPAPDARRFECGSPNMLGAHALKASTDLLLEVGLENVRQAIAERVHFLADRLSDIPGLTAITPAQSGQRLGIFTFRVEGFEASRLQHGLMKRGVICACRGGGVRFSPHFYTPYEQMERALGILEKLLTR